MRYYTEFPYTYSHRTRILHGGCVISVIKYRHDVQNLSPIAVYVLVMHTA